MAVTVVPDWVNEPVMVIGPPAMTPVARPPELLMVAIDGKAEVQLVWLVTIAVEASE